MTSQIFEPLFPPIHNSQWHATLTIFLHHFNIHVHAWLIFLTTYSSWPRTLLTFFPQTHNSWRHATQTDFSNNSQLTSRIANTLFPCTLKVHSPTFFTNTWPPTHSSSCHTSQTPFPMSKVWLFPMILSRTHCSWRHTLLALFFHDATSASKV